MSFPHNVTITAQMQIALSTSTAPFVVYLLHFSSPVPKKNAKCLHYLGLTSDVAKRLKRHAAGAGSGLVRAALDRGEVVLVELWEQDGNFERKLKKRKNAGGICPICRQRDGLKPNIKFREVTDEKHNGNDGSECASRADEIAF